MRKFILIALAILLAMPIAIAQQPGGQFPPRSEAGRTTEKTFYSELFGTDRAYSIYLPRDYETNPNRSYPIFYLLHGASDDNRCYENKAGLSSIANQLVAAGEAIDMIIVTPNAGGTEYEGYYNMDGNKYPYEQFFFDEFMPYIESNYRVKSGKENRAIGGLSMGGGGCVWYALSRPDLFCAVYEMSGALSIDETSSLWNPRNELAAKKKASYLEHICSERIAEATPEEIEAYKSILWYADCGDDDFTIDYNWDFFKAMKKAGVPCQLRIRDGGHTWTYWTSGLNIALPLLSARFGRIE
jgi:S-formylglutathione hydrolase FrmB